MEIALADAIAALPPPYQGRTTEEWDSVFNKTYEGSERVPVLRPYTGYLIAHTHRVELQLILRMVWFFNVAQCRPSVPPQEVEKIVVDIAQRLAESRS